MAAKTIEKSEKWENLSKLVKHALSGFKVWKVEMQLL